MEAKELFDWYYCPGEAMLSIGFYRNPYRQWQNAQFRHIFAFDGVCNLYVGQYSVYSDHMNKICDLNDQRECGLIYPADSNIPPKDVDKLNLAEICGFDEDTEEYEKVKNNFERHNPYIHTKLPVVEFKFIETKNIHYLNRRLPKIAQRLIDYGLPKDTILFSPEIDLWNIRLYQILKDKLIKDRPSEESLQAIL